MKVQFAVRRSGPTVKETTEGTLKRIELAVNALSHEFKDAAVHRCPVSGTVRRGRLLTRTGTKKIPGWVRLEAERRKPGDLRRSIMAKVWSRGRQYYGSVGFTEPYGIYVEFGSAGPSGVIRPVRKRALTFYVRGRLLIIRKSSRGGPISVGTAKQPRTSWKAKRGRGAMRRKESMPFLRPAWYLDTRPRARKIFRNALKRTGGVV